MKILDDLEIFSFAIIPGPAGRPADVVKAQGLQWAEHGYEVDMTCFRDVRAICLSEDGPMHMPAIRKAILLSEVHDRSNPITLFVSSVNDGYVAMLLAISRRIQEPIITFRLSSMDREHPGNFIQSFLNGQSQRTVYTTRDENGKWDFFEQGDLLHFEDPELYKTRRKRDRLNPEIVSDYLKKLGYVSLDREFWISDHEPARLLAHRDFRIGNYGDTLPIAPIS
jgi:hypothetical protein